MPTHISTCDELDSILDTNQVVILDFYMDTCAPCKAIAPEFEKLASEFRDVLFVKWNAGDAHSLAMLCEVYSVPTFIRFDNGNESGRFSGADKKKLRSLIEENGDFSSRRSGKNDTVWLNKTMICILF